MPINFFSHKISFQLNKKKANKKLLLSIIQKEKKKPGDINFIFCNDKFLLLLNKKFLKHNTLTDILTFQYSHDKLSGDIFISIPRVKENAKKYRVTFENELLRVMIHGILHLCGYKDKTKSEKEEMRTKESLYLAYSSIDGKK
jgi:rRNA maturation RNase YbeY